MDIGIDLAPEGKRHLSLFYNCLVKEVSLLAQHHREHAFTIYNITKEGFHPGANVSTAARVRPKRSWVPALLKPKKQERPGLVIEWFHPSLHLTPGVVAIVSDLGPLLHAELYNKKEISLFKKRLAEEIDKPSMLIVPSVFYKQLLSATFQVASEKIKLFDFRNLSVPSPFTWDMKEHIKAHYTKGNEYFLFAGDLHPRFALVLLLKAFSHFKKWQKSSMHLVVAGYSGGDFPITPEMFASYKYRNDLVLVENPSEQELDALTGGAYAFLYPALYDPFPQPVLRAMRMQVPVIATDVPEIRELAGDSITYTDKTEEAISVNMQRIFKDELWRKDLIKQATGHLSQLPGLQTVERPGILLNELIAK